MKFPRVILEVALNSNERAAIMGGQEKPRDHDAGRVRIVLKGEKQGFPILALETAGDLDAMGECQWHKAELPWQIVMSIYHRHVSAITKSHEERCAEVVQCIKDSSGRTHGDDLRITEKELVTAVARGLAKWRSA